MIPRVSRVPRTESLYADFAVELRIHGFLGEISDSYADRTALATDNSIYQVLPQLTAFPRNIEDLQRVTRIAAQARFRSIKLYPRGGGTGTNGQSLGDGVIVDVSRHMNGILEINHSERWARVQAGVVKDQLEAALKPYGLFFAPELSTSNRATIGGMINTDASGQGSCLYGKTRDHVLALTTVLMDGTIWESQPISDEALAGIQSADTLIGNAHRVIDRIQKDDGALIDATFPRLNRCLTGYDLAHIRDAAGCFNLNNILCGSEGSLGFIAEAKINLLPIPGFSALLVVSYASFDAALRDAPRLLKMQATSIETVDSVVLQLARGDNTWHTISRFFPATGTAFDGVNLVEFTADTQADLENTLARAIALLDGGANSPDVVGYTMTDDPDEVDRIWSMRKRSVGLLGGMNGDSRPIPFVEDTAVPPENLADYIREFRDLLDSHGVRYGMFGHADAGVLHVRPAIDMKDPEQEKLIRRITDGVVALVHKYHGVLWGEHGKGLRSEYAPGFFGPLYPRLQDIKASFDPHNQLNPGKIVSPHSDGLIRLDQTPTRGQHDRVIPLAVRNDFADSLHCNGNGACFNFDADDAMCPSWKGSRDRRFSPKGRASLLREWLRLIAAGGHARTLGTVGDGFWRAVLTLPAKLRHTLGKQFGEYDFSHEVLASMNSCLACKSCTGQCPIKVDIPQQRAKFLELYHTRYLRPLKDHLLAWLEPLLPVLAKTPRLINALLGSGFVQTLLKKLNLAEIPLLSETALEPALRREGFALATEDALSCLGAERKQAVIVVQDAFTTHFEAELVLDTFRLLRSLGFIPLLAPYLPNGKPLQVHGFSRQFEATARRNACMLNALAATGVPLIGIDPAMTLTYRAEYRQALGDMPSPPVSLLQEWLGQALPATVPPAKQDTYHLLPHCTERTNAPAAMSDWVGVFAALGHQLKVLPSGCCGMAGTFGHEASNRPLSEDIYRLSWAPPVGRHKDSGTLMASGYSCRCQAKIIDDVALPHPVQILLGLQRNPVNSQTAS